MGKRSVLGQEEERWRLVSRSLRERSIDVHTLLPGANSACFTIADPENWVALFAFPDYFNRISPIVSEGSSRSGRRTVAASRDGAPLQFQPRHPSERRCPSRSGRLNAGKLRGSWCRFSTAPATDCVRSTSGQLRTAGHESSKRSRPHAQTVVHGTLDRSNDTLVFPVTLGGRRSEASPQST